MKYNNGVMSRIDNNRYLNLGDPDKARAWLPGFNAKMRINKVIDNKENKTFNITDSFSCVCWS